MKKKDKPGIVQPSVTLPVNTFHMLGVSGGGNLVVVSLKLLKEEVDKEGEATSPQPPHLLQCRPRLSGPLRCIAAAVGHWNLPASYTFTCWPFDLWSKKKKTVCEGVLAFISDSFIQGGLSLISPEHRDSIWKLLKCDARTHFPWRKKMLLHSVSEHCSVLQNGHPKMTWSPSDKTQHLAACVAYNEGLGLRFSCR